MTARKTGKDAKNKGKTSSGSADRKGGGPRAGGEGGGKCQTPKGGRKASGSGDAIRTSRACDGGGRTVEIVRDGRRIRVPVDEKGHASDEFLASHFSDCGSGRAPGRRANSQSKNPDRYDAYLVVDEFGDVKPYHPTDPTFGFTTTTTRDPERMQRIAQENRRLHGTDEEVKAADDTWAHRMRMAAEFMRSDMKSETYYVDKKSPPKGWDVDRHKNDSDSKHSRRKNEVRRNLLEDSIKKAVKPLDGEIMVVIDEHTSYRNIGDIGKNLSDRHKQVTTEKHRSQDKGEYPDMLQTNDYITYAAGDATRGNPLLASLMGMRMRRYKETDNIEKGGK